MARNTPEGDKTNVNEKKAKKKGKQGSDNVSDCSSSTVSFDSIEYNLLPYDNDFDQTANYELLQKKLQQYFDNKLLLMRTEFEGKINVLHEVINNKDNTIGELYTEIGELKQSYSFLSQETTMLVKKTKETEISLSTANKNHESLVDKTSDLEDRSRRNNIVFYNIPESTINARESEDCDSIIINLLKSRGFFKGDYTLEIDRAHRLGRKQAGVGRPRPIIVRFSFYKDKELVMKNGRLFKGCEVNASEDYSKITLGIHKQLHTHAKDAKFALNNDDTQTISIVHHKVTYRRVVLTYKSNNNAASSPEFTRSFNLQYVLSNRKWFIPPTRNTYSNVQRLSNTAS